LKGDVLLARQQPQAARETYQLALSNGGDAAELQKKIARIVTPTQWRLDVGYGSDNFSNSRGTEHNGFVQLGYQVNPQLSVYGRYELARQFGSNDATYFVGSYWQPAPAWLLFGEIGQTPDADFRPDTQALLGVEYLGFSQVQPLLSYRHSQYDGSTTVTPGVISGKGNVKTITPGVRLVWPGAGNLELRVGFSENIDGSSTKVNQIRLNIDAGDRWSPYIAYFKGEEALPPQAFASFKVVVVGAVYRLNDAWSLRADFANEQRRNFYTRNSLSVGVGYRF
jgi:YaiO family outer membrane protein